MNNNNNTNNININNNENFRVLPLASSLISQMKSKKTKNKYFKHFCNISIFKIINELENMDPYGIVFIVPRLCGDYIRYFYHFPQRAILEITIFLQ